MSKRRRNRPVHHEDIGLALSPQAMRALQPRLTPPAAKAAAPKPVVLPPPAALSALAQAILPSAVKSGVAAVMNPTALAALSKASAAATPQLTSAQLQKISNATAKISSSTARLRASAAKNKKLGGKLSKIASALDAKAAKLKSAAMTPAAAHRIMGVDWGSIASHAIDGTALLNAAVQMIAQGSEADAISVASDINQEMSDSITQLQGMQQTAQVTTLISQATDFGNNAYDIVNNYDPAAGDSTVPTRVAALQTNVNAWEPTYWSAARNPALNPAMPGSTLPGATNPTAVPGMMSLMQAMGPNDLVAYVNTTTGAPPQGIIQIDSEQIAYSAVTPNSFNGLQRAYNPNAQQYGAYAATPPVSHAAGAMVSFAYQGQGAGSFDPGQYGGGGGGGGGGSGGSDDWPDDGGGSDAVSQFRQGVDPFADEDDGSAPVTPDGSDGGFDDSGMYADAADPGMSQDDLNQSLLNQDDGGDSFTEDQLLSAVQTDDGSMLTPNGATPGGAFNADDYALLEHDSPEIPDAIVGGGFWDNWSQIFYNPAGLLVDAMSTPQKSNFQAHVASPTTTGRWRASSASQQNLTAAQQRLAQTQAALQAGRNSYLQQLMASTGQSAPLFQTSPQASSPLSRYSGSGAFVGPIATVNPIAPQTTDAGDAMPTDDSLSADSVAGLALDEVENICCGVEAMTGYPISDDVQDIIINAYDHQITDEAPSYERGPAARHGGAAYLDPTYPRGGSVAGRQGGLIQPEEKIIVGHNNRDVFFGGCYSHGLDVLGAGVGTAKFNALPRSPGKPTVRAGFVQKTTPRGRKFMSLQVLNPKHHDHTASIKNARDAGKRAIAVADKVDNQVKKAALAVHRTAVHGDLIGASRVVARGVAHHLLTSAQLVKATKAARDLGKKALKAADKHEKGIATLNAKIKTGAAAARSRLKMGSAGKTTVIHGIDDETADLYLDAASDVIFGACTPDPNDPGWCTDGTVDPSYGGTGGGGYGLPSDPSTLPTDGSAENPGPPDYGLGPAPTPDSVAPQPGVDYVADPFPGGQGDFVPYSSTPLDPSFAMGQTQDLPVGAIIYDGSVSPPFEGLGSYAFFYGDTGGAPPKGGEHSGEIWHNDGWWSFLHDAYAGPAGSGDQRLNHEDDNSATAMQQRANNSFKFNWGPMIGNPSSALRGLRYDVGGNQWFWYYDQAPDWAKAPVKQALINQAILDYQAQLAAAAADYASQQAADKLAAEQAKQLQQQQAMEDSQMQHQMELEQQQAQQDASVQALADQAQAQEQQTQDTSYAAQTQAEAQAQAALEQSEALTQAKIDQQELEQLARLAAQEQQAQQMSNMQSPDADAGDSAWVPDPNNDNGDVPYDGYGDAKSMLDDSE